MEITFEEIKNLAEQKIKALKEELSKWEKLYEAANVENTVAVSNGSADQIKKELSNSLNTAQSNMDYDPNAAFEDKVIYYANKIKRSFSSKEFAKFFEQVEGPERTQQQIQGNLLHQKFNYMRKSSKVVYGAKFGNSNHNTYYLLRDWLTDDKLDIKAEHYPTMEAFGNLPNEKRCKEHLQILK